MNGLRALLFGFLGDASAQEQREERRRVGAEVDSELEHHLQLLADACRADGIPESDLDRAVRARFGDPGAVRRACMNQRTRGLLMKQRIHRLITAALALAVLALLTIQWQARAAARAQMDALRCELEVSMQRLAESRPEASPADATTAGIGDLVQVEALPADLRGTYVVDADGAVLLPNLGRVPVAGLTAEEVGRLLSERAEPYYLAPEIRVALHRAAPATGDR